MAEHNNADQVHNNADQVHNNADQVHNNADQVQNNTYITDISNEIFNLKDQISDGAYLKLMNLLKKKHEQKNANVGDQIVYVDNCVPKYMYDNIVKICICTLSSFLRSANKLLLYNIVPTLQYILNIQIKLILPINLYLKKLT
jgi:hypothetical protein